MPSIVCKHRGDDLDHQLMIRSKSSSFFASRSLTKLIWLVCVLLLDFLHNFLRPVSVGETAQYINQSVFVFGDNKEPHKLVGW